MVNEGREITDRLSLHGMEVKCDQLPISAIVKCPMLALRYSLRDQGKVKEQSNEERQLTLCVDSSHPASVRLV